MIEKNFAKGMKNAETIRLRQYSAFYILEIIIN